MWILRKFRLRFMVSVITLFAVGFMMTCFLATSQISESPAISSSVDRALAFLSPSMTRELPEVPDSSINNSVMAVDDFVRIFSELYRKTDNALFRLDIHEPYGDFLIRLNMHKKKGVMLMRIPDNNKKPKNSLERFYEQMNQYYLYDPLNSTVIPNLLEDLSTQPLVAKEVIPSGNQFKLLVTFANGVQGVVKPMRRAREQDSPLDVPFYDLFERHTAEIAAFHLDRILGFHRVPPAVGRVFNITKDLLGQPGPWNPKTSFTSSDGRLCFLGECTQYCGENNPLCGDPDTLEASVAALLPHKRVLNRVTKANPWQRNYDVTEKAVWEEDETYCERMVKFKSPFNETRLLLDILDLSVFDFLIDNMDRHHLSAFTAMWPNTSLVHYDHGRGFAKAHNDCPSCLAPIRQCCMIRLSTLAKLIKLYQGPDSLSQVMRTSLTSDTLAPILTEPHLDALDRRLGKVLHLLTDCVNSGRTWDSVVIDDGFV